MPRWLAISSHHCLDGKRCTAVSHEDLTDFPGIEVALESTDVIDDEADLPQGAIDPLSQLDEDTLDGQSVGHLLLRRHQLLPQEEGSSP